MNPAFNDEVQFLAWGDGPQGPWIKLKLPDSDDLGPFRGMTQAKATMVGQRMACVLVEIGDDEKPVESDFVARNMEHIRKHATTVEELARPKGGELAKLAGRLCADPKFQEWLWERTPAIKLPLTMVNVPSGVDVGGYLKGEEGAAFILRDLCDISSRAELDHDGAAAARFHELIRKPWLEFSK